MFESINGVPSHVLFVHAPVVLVPLLMLAALALLLRPAWRRPFSGPLALFSVVSFVATMLARQSGNAFDDLLDGAVDTAQHEQLGDQTALIVFVLMLLCLVGAAVLRRSPPPETDAANVVAGDAPELSARPQTSVASTGLIALITLVSILATFWMVRTGDVGARLVWEGNVPGL